MFKLLAMCLTGFLIHGIMPDLMLSVILVPVIKDMTGKINSKDIYRPIVHASILFKVFEQVFYDRFELYLLTNDNQCDFKC